MVAKQNVLTRSKKNKAAELFSANRLEEADAAYASVCQIDKMDADAWVARGIINRKLGRFNDSEACCLRALEVNPALARAHHALGAAVQCLGRKDEAIASYRRATQLQPDFAEAYYFLANALREADSMLEAAAAYRQAIKLQPDFVEALSNLGAVLTSLGETQEAVSVLNKAIVLRPNTPQILCNMGNILQREGRLAEALDKYGRALRLAPDSMDAISHAATLLEKVNRIEEAAELVNQHLPRVPDNADLLVVAAKLARRANQTDEAIALLERAARQPLGQAAAGEVHLHLGQMYDRKGDAERAFEHLAEGNRLIAQATASIHDSQNKYPDRVKRIRSYLTPDLAESVGHDLNEDVTQAPVFLLGFPRSGTTLLEQILDSHPALQTLEEKGTVSAMVQAFEEMAQGRVNALAELSQDQIRQLRKVYFDEVARHIERQPNCLLVDKMPLNTVNVHLIWRVFPKAKFILAIRHPCDVCLSCFMQNFLVNVAMAGFFTLESGATIYSEAMRTWQDAVSLLPLDYHRIRYEDLVADFENETRALLDFLGVGWDESVLGHTDHAIKRGTINTPSYHQVTQPIYQHAKYRWKRYAKQFEPVMPTLKPFIDYFGYAE